MAVTPGPEQPVGLKSLLCPIAEELNELAKGIPGLMVAGSTTPQVVTAAELNFATDQPGGNKLTQFKGINSYIYNRLRLLKGVYFSASNHIYYPPKDPASGNTLFEIEDCIEGQECIATPRRATSIAASAAVVEDARTAGRSIAYQTSLEQKTGIKGYSLFFAPSPAMSEAYPHLKNLWEMGPTPAPYDTMHLVLLNVFPHMWELFAGLKLVDKKKDEAYNMSKATVALVGRELEGSRRTVPRAQARSLRNIDFHQKSFKAVEWLHFSLCSGEVLLALRIPGNFYDIFMALFRASRLLFWPRGVTRAEIQAIDADIKYFVTNCYGKIYRGSTERLPLCLSTIATLLDIVPLLWAVGPAWDFWQFPMERKIGTLGKLIRSHSRPHASLVNSLTRQCKAELINSFGEKYLPKEWADATGKRPAATGLPGGRLTIPQVIGADCALFPPRNAPATLSGEELTSMRAVLAQKQANEVPPDILAKTYCRINMASGKIAGSKPFGSDCDKHRSRNYVVRINSTELVRLPNGSVEERPVSTFGAVLHYAAVFIDGRVMAFDFVERAKSTKERRGRFGYSGTNYEIEVILGLGGTRYYVPVGALDEAVGTIERQGMRFI